MDIRGLQNLAENNQPCLKKIILEKTLSKNKESRYAPLEAFFVLLNKIRINPFANFSEKAHNV